MSEVSKISTWYLLGGGGGAVWNITHTSVTKRYCGKSESRKGKHLGAIFPFQSTF